MLLDSFNNKRDKFNRPITFESQELSYNISNKFLLSLNKYPKYKFITKYIEKKFIDVYLYKIIYDSILPINNIYLVNENFKSKKKIRVFLHSIRFKLNYKIVNILYPNFHKKYKLIIENKENKYKKIIIFLYSYFRNFVSNLLKSNFKKKTIYNSYNKIAIRATSVIAIKDNSLSWLKFSNLYKRYFLIYFESYKELKDMGGNKYIQYLENNNYNYLVLSKSYNNNYKLFDNIKKDLKKIKSYSDVDEWLSGILEDLLNKISFWYNFFRNNKIIIHEDSTPNNIDNIVKHIAIKFNEGITYSIQRSYPMSFDGIFASYYNNDIFFCWGDHSKKLFEKTFNSNHKFINTGIFYDSTIISDNYQETYKFFSNSNIDYIILLLDTNHDYNLRPINDNYNLNYQVVYTEDIQNF